MKDREETWVVYTDGSADPQTGATGWAAVALKNGWLRLEVQGWEIGRDSAWAEFRAVREALSAVPGRVRVVVHTDHFALVEVFRGKGRLRRPDLRALWDDLRSEAARRGLELDLRYRRRQKTLWSRWVHRQANGARQRALSALAMVSKAA